MLTKKDIARLTGTLATKKDLDEAINRAVAPLASKEDLAKAIAPLASKVDLAKLETRLIKHEVKSDANFARLERKTDKGFSELKRAIKTEHKVGVEDFRYLEKETHVTKQRVERVERHLGLAPISA